MKDGSRTTTNPSPFRAEDGFPEAVHRGQLKLADCPVKREALHRGNRRLGDRARFNRSQ
jgi:hypothetical protein